MSTQSYQPVGIIADNSTRHNLGLISASIYSIQAEIERLLAQTGGGGGGVVIPTNVVITNPGFTDRNLIQPLGLGVNGLVLQAPAGSPTSNPLEVRNSSGTVNARFTWDGALALGSATAPPTQAYVVGGSGVSSGLRMQNVETNATIKIATLKVGHYTNSEEPVTILQAISSSSQNIVYIGGVGADENAATGIDFYTAANTTTLTGTRRGGFGSTGNFDIAALAGTGTRLTTSTSTGVQGNATTIAGAYTWSGFHTFSEGFRVANNKHVEFSNAFNYITCDTDTDFFGISATGGSTDLRLISDRDISIVASEFSGTLLLDSFAIEIDGATTVTALAGTGTRNVRASSAGLLSSATTAAILEDIGSTRGQMLTRGASAWGVVNVGALGTIWHSDGTDPGWATLATAGIAAGTGTENTLTKWTGTATIGNSSVTDNGTAVTSTVEFRADAGLRVGGGATAFVTGDGNTWLYRSASTGANPFNEAGHLFLQSRSSANRDIIFVTGSAPAIRMRIDEVNTAITTTLGVTGIANFNNTTDASSISTGSLITAGGLGVAKNLHVGLGVTMSGALSVGTTAGFTGAATFNNSVLATAGSTVGAGGTAGSPTTKSVSGLNWLQVTPTGADQYYSLTGGSSGQVLFITNATNHNAFISDGSGGVASMISRNGLATLTVAWNDVISGLWKSTALEIPE